MRLKHFSASTAVMLVLGSVLLGSGVVPVSTGTSSYWVGASSSDSTALPNTGVLTTAQVVSVLVSGCLSFWVSDDLSNSMWGQVGYVICNGSTPFGFYQIWNLATGKMVCQCGNGVLLAPGYHTFSMYLRSGTTWAFKVDTAVMGTYNMGASLSSSSYPVYALSEESGVSSPYQIPLIEFSTAMQTLQAGVWHNVASAISYGDSWGVRGQEQTSTLSADQIQVGGTLLVPPVGSSLWSSSHPTDTTPPKVSISSPLSGAGLEGTVTVSFSTSDNVGVTKVQLFVDGTLYGSDTSSPFSISLKTTDYPDGTHTLLAIAYDAAGNSGKSSGVTVIFLTPDVTIISPLAGSRVSGTVLISASVVSPAGVKSVTFSVDGVVICALSIGPYDCSWNSSLYSAGTHTIAVRVTDLNGFFAKQQISVTD